MMPCMANWEWRSQITKPCRDLVIMVQQTIDFNIPADIRWRTAQPGCHGGHGPLTQSSCSPWYRYPGFIAQWCVVPKNKGREA